MKKRWVAAGAIAALSLSAWAGEKHFDPDADPAKDLAKAEKQASAEHKNILMDVGGDWCVWCLALDRTFEEDHELHDLLTKNYVLLKVNMSKENENKAFLGKYPAAAGYPQWYVLGPEGKLLKTENTSELEKTHKIADAYNREALKSFLLANAPKR